MKLVDYFKYFLTRIRLNRYQSDNLKAEHEKLRELLKKDGGLSDIFVDTFLQGSYRRSTIIKPTNDEKPDVDIIVVTNLDKDICTPENALNTFKDFLDEHYEDKHEKQGRSIGIYLDDVDLDLVVTSAPSESQKDILKQFGEISNLNIEDFEKELINKTFNSVYESAKKTKEFFEKSSSQEWKLEPLYIPDRDADEWKQTHPLEQIRWTIEKNNNTNKHYVNVVKALKWWKKEKYPDTKHPKSYPFEHFIGECCPDGIGSVAEGITLTLENMAKIEDKPVLPDRGVPEHDVFARIKDEEYEKFHSQVSEAAVIARDAFDSDDKDHSITKWKELFGSNFDNPLPESKAGGYSERTEKSPTDKGRFG